MVIYEPAEDSFLLSEIIAKKAKHWKKKTILEMGAGSGCQMQTLLDEGVEEKNCTLVDINSQAVRELKKAFPLTQVVRSDLFKKVKGTYDVIIFNPPYLPKDVREPRNSRRETTGGKTGSEVANRFLDQAHKFLKSNGRVLLVVSSLTKGLNTQGYRKKIVGRKKVFFEELLVYELWEKS